MSSTYFGVSRTQVWQNIYVNRIQIAQVYLIFNMFWRVKMSIFLCPHHEMRYRSNRNSPAGAGQKKGLITWHSGDGEGGLWRFHDIYLDKLFSQIPRQAYYGSSRYVLKVTLLAHLQYWPSVPSGLSCSGFMAIMVVSSSVMSMYSSTPLATRSWGQV